MRINAQDKHQSALAIATLKWVTYAKAQLKIEALQHALAVTPGCREINEMDLIDVDQLISFCMGIVIIDHESGIIRLVHYTI